MNNEFNLVYSPKFLEDFNEINAYIKYELENKIAANKFITTVEKEIKNRLINPIGYEKFKTEQNNTYYKIYVNNFIIFYTVNDNCMEIRRIIYGMRDMTNLL